LSETFDILPFCNSKKAAFLELQQSFDWAKQGRGILNYGDIEALSFDK
jgi:hypothetical protein